MNKLTTILTVLVLQLGFSQENINIFADAEIINNGTMLKLNVDGCELGMHAIFKPILQEYIRDAELRGVYISERIINEIDYIMVNIQLGTHPGDNRLGVVTPNLRGVYISPRILGDYELTRFVVYHELGHILRDNPEHTCNSCDSLMMANIPVNFMHMIRSKYSWNILLNDYFKKIR